jgi:hypothetical protein
LGKNNTIWLLYLYLLIASFPVGCAGTDKVGVDLVEYVNQDILGIAQLETKALAHYAAVTGPNYTDDQTLLTALDENVIPLYKRFVDLLGKVHPRRDEIRQLHAVYISGAGDLYKGFTLIRTGLERKDETLIRAANTEIESGRLKTEQWRRQLFSLYEAHGVRSAAETKDPAPKGQLVEPPVD